MKTSKNKEQVDVEQKEGEKPKESERTENIVAIGVFVFLIIIGVAIFTKGFGLFDKEMGGGQRVSVPLGNDPYIGNSNASALIIVFSDYECPNCKVAEDVMKRVLETYGDKVLYVFKDYPLTSIHPDSYNAALAAECAKEQSKFWEYHGYLFEHQEQLSAQSLKEYANNLSLDASRFNECFDTQRYKKEVDADIITGKQIGVPGTPTFFINGLPVIGIKSEQDFINIINSEIKSGRRN